MPVPTLLVCLTRTVGHFTVYTSNLLDWARKRGFQAACLLPAPDRTNLFQKFKNSPEIRFLDLADFLPNRFKACLGEGDAAILRDLFSGEGLDWQIQAVNAAQRLIGAEWTALINSDDMLFNSNMFFEREKLFQRPTYGVSTFGFRDFHLGFEDVYTHRINRLNAECGNFTGMFTLDEHHVAHDDPRQEFLIFFPDPYKEFERLPEERLPVLERRQLDELRVFLAQGQTPLIPLIGKLDARKNGLWLLEQVARRPDYGAVLLGERVRASQGPDARADARIDAILDTLRAQGRVFVKPDFTTEHFFQAAFESPRVRFAPFAYKTHYGSSAVHLHALEAGKPCLVADVGLMAQRTVAHGLGALFAHDEREDFDAAFERLAENPPTIHPAPFLSCFSQDRLFACLDYGFGISSTPPETPVPYDADRHSDGPAYFAPFQQGLAQLRRRENDCGAAAFDAALALRPGHSCLLLRRALAAAASGDDAFCRKLVHAQQQRQPPPAELEFAFPLFFHLGAHYLDERKLELAERCLDFCRLLDPKHEALRLAEIHALHKANRHDEALRAIEAYRESQPDTPEIAWRRLDILLDADRIDQALEQANNAIRDFEAQGQELHLFAMRKRRMEILADAGLNEEALTAVTEALGFPGMVSDPLAHQEMLRIQLPLLQLIGSPDTICEAARTLLKISPEESEAAHFLAIGLLRQGSPKDALDQLLPHLTPQIQELANSQKHYWRTAGGAYAALRNFEKAIACFEETLRLDPEFHEIRLNLSDARRYAKDYAAAMRALDELEAAAPEHAGLHLKRGQVLFEQERYEEALASFEREAAKGEISDFLRGYLEKTRAKLLDTGRNDKADPKGRP
jgi:tetratricopeptide (TPR) repeat protein